jgi:hypothetical protein
MPFDMARFKRLSRFLAHIKQICQVANKNGMTSISVEPSSMA